MRREISTTPTRENSPAKITSKRRPQVDSVISDSGGARKQANSIANWYSTMPVKINCVNSRGTCLPGRRQPTSTENSR